MREVAVGPFDGRGVLVVMTDVAHELARQVLDRGEDPAGDHIAFDPGEPQFNLIEPRGIGRSEMQVHLGMLGQELCDPLGLMRREVVGDDVDLAALGCSATIWPRKATNSSVVWRAAVLTQDLAAFGVERSVERERAMPIVLEAVALGPPGLSGNTGSRRSRAWIAVFSSTQNTAACCGGLTYSPITSAALRSKSGSSEAM